MDDIASPKHPTACAFHPLTRVVEAKDYEDLRERLERLTATFQIVKTHSGEHKLVVTSPNGDCYEFRAHGERAGRVLRDAAAALNPVPAKGGSEA